MSKCTKCNKSATPQEQYVALCCLLNEMVENSSSGAEETVDELKEVNENLVAIKEQIEELLEELRNDEAFSESLWENLNGDVVIRRVVLSDDGVPTIEFLNQDGTPYTGSLTELKPYSRQVISSETEYCANDVPFTLIQFRDHDSKQVVATIWRNDNTLVESPTAPAGATKGACVAAAACKENKTYQIKGTQTITFDPNKIYGYKAGVWNISNPITPLTGKVSLTEGAGLIQEYGFGDSFGNGFGDVLMPTSVVIAGLDADADVRISVIQECGYTATIV